MTNKLPCAVVRDLLPSYAEGLTEPETSQLVQDHLQDCPGCSAHYEAMRSAPEQTIQQEQQKEVDYLKTVRRKNLRKVVLAVVGTLMAALLCLLAQVFLIGRPVTYNQAGIQFYPDVDGTAATVQLYSSDSANVFTGVKLHQQGDVVELTARSVLVSPFHSAQSYEYRIELDGVRQVNILGRTVWEEGLTIQQDTSEMVENKTPYMGSAWAVSQAASTLPLPQVNFAWQLQSEQEPYGVTLLFEEALDQVEQQQMEQAAPLLMALVGNLGRVDWTFPVNGTIQTGGVTLADTNARLADLTRRYNEAHGTDWQALDSVKDYAESAYTMEQLRCLLRQPNLEQAVDELVNSISVQGDVLQFTIPQDCPGPGEWYIHISGILSTVDADDMGVGMSSHWFEEESDTGSWVPGKTYTMEIGDATYEELFMDVFLPDGTDRYVDLLRFFQNDG